jgi:hypothetical protein
VEKHTAMSRIQIDEHELRELLEAGGDYEEIEAAPAPAVSPVLEMVETVRNSLAELLARPTPQVEIPGMTQLMVEIQAMTLALSRPIESPVIHVAAPNVQVAAPNVQVPREMASPAPRIWEHVVAERDAQGKIKKIISTAID